MSGLSPVAWVERTEGGLTRMWSGELSAWGDRPADPEPLYSQATVDTLRAQLEAAVQFAANQGALRMAAEARAEAAEAECSAMRSLIERVVADTKWRSDDNTLWPDLCAAARTKEQQA